MVTRAPRPFPATRSSSISTTGAAHVKSELGSPYSGPGSGNEADNDRGGDTSAMSSRDESMHRANESDGDFSMDKAPRSLRGITSIADPSASIPSGLATESSGTSSAYASPYPGHQHFGQPRENDQQHYSHPASYMMHSRRHTVPDASRNVFPSGTMSGVETNSVSLGPYLGILHLYS